MANNFDPAIAQFVYGTQFQTALDELLLPMDSWVHNVTEFATGETFRIPSVSQRTIQDVPRGSPVVATPIGMGSTTMTINQRTGDAIKIDLDDEEDGFLVSSIIAQQISAMARGFKEDVTAKMLSAAVDAQTDANANLINGSAHRRVGTGTNNALTLDDVRGLGLAFDLANVSKDGRVLIVSPEQSHTLLGQLAGAASNDRNMRAQQLLEQGISDSMGSYVMPLFGFDVFESKHLVSVASGTDYDGTGATSAATKAAIALSVVDDNAKALAMATRRQPTLEMAEDKYTQTKSFISTMRWGSHVKRLDTVATIAAS